ncbi:MAG: hypothetical protein LBO62_05045 [Endomicrobium sp.]|jgi:hypothetical protein|nr:hypothetical protein [Endomicrobium sp.]
MKKRFAAIITVLFITVYSMPQEVFASAVSFFINNNNAVCAQIPKTAAVLNLLDISKKVAANHFNTAKKFFTACFANGDLGETREITKIPFAAFNNLKSEFFMNFSKGLKISPSFLYFYSTEPAALTRSEPPPGVLANLILLRLKTVFMATAPCDEINTIILIKYFNPAYIV